MKRRLTMILACLFLSVGMALAQTRVTGVITSAEDGQPVVGASVKAKGLNTGATSNVDGEFTLNVPLGTELEIVYLGMEPLTVKATQNMRIVLEPAVNELENVVVTGYGSARKLSTRPADSPATQSSTSRCAVSALYARAPLLSSSWTARRSTAT